MNKPLYFSRDKFLEWAKKNCYSTLGKYKLMEWLELDNGTEVTPHNEQYCITESNHLVPIETCEECTE